MHRLAGSALKRATFDLGPSSSDCPPAGYQLLVQGERKAIVVSAEASVIKINMLRIALLLQNVQMIKEGRGPQKRWVAVKSRFSVLADDWVSKARMSARWYRKQVRT
jgi:CRISPR/Cas system CMR subunit Cmr4 (Cas7 group RAMP superfamily)